VRGSGTQVTMSQEFANDATLIKALSLSGVGSPEK
jgi:hypothetical protein